MSSYRVYQQTGLALDPIHVGTGGARIGRVDLTIVRDPATCVPKIPGSSLAGVYRTYVAMAEHERNPNRQVNGEPWPYYPNCAGLGQAREDKEYQGHCGRNNCPVCTVFGFARGRDASGGFAGLAAFSDAHVLLFPVPTRKGPFWITCPMAMRLIVEGFTEIDEDALHRPQEETKPLNLGWLLLPVKALDNWDERVDRPLRDKGIPDYILRRVGVVSDKLFTHIVNSNLEVRTSVAINPETGAAEEGALFSYEALPRATILYWEIICRNPQHFRVDGQPVVVRDSNRQATIEDIYEVVKEAHPYLEHLGIGGMGTRGMGRLRVLFSESKEERAGEEVK
ncbi:type III-B CRISPR module RAMP protein Cmr4 [Candidatus Poribacteria bacterium]|nr:MAG: type III-B CRISPR module RAMP protein Cmr4 [Candidatus Poribacteria bacterium]